MLISKVIEILEATKLKYGDINIFIQNPYFDEGGYNGEEESPLCLENFKVEVDNRFTLNDNKKSKIIGIFCKGFKLILK